MHEVATVLLRSAMTFAGLLVFSRILGKTQLAQLTYFEWVTGITIGSIAGVLSADLAVRPWPTFVSLAAWVMLTLAASWVAIRSNWIGKMLDGQPVVVVQNGQILEKNLRALRMRVSELNSMLRAQGVFDYSQVEFAMLEPHGALSVLKRSQDRPVTPRDLQIPTTYEGLAIELVVSGEIMSENLRRLKVNRAWLMDKLREQGIFSLDEVFYAVIDSSGKVFADRYADRVPPTDEMGDYPGPN